MADALSRTCEAVTRPSMSFVRVKGLEQQGLSTLRTACSQLINTVRGHLSELGISRKEACLGSPSWQQSCVPRATTPVPHQYRAN